MLNAFIYDGLRTPIGRHAGKLSTVRPDDLAAGVIAEVVKRNGVKPEQISDVILGCVTQAGEDSRNVARFAALASGLPPSVPGVTVNRRRFTSSPTLEFPGDLDGPEPGRACRANRRKGGKEAEHRLVR